MGRQGERRKDSGLGFCRVRGGKKKKKKRGGRKVGGGRCWAGRSSGLAARKKRGWRLVAVRGLAGERGRGGRGLGLWWCCGGGERGNGGRRRRRRRRWRSARCSLLRRGKRKASGGWSADKEEEKGREGERWRGLRGVAEVRCSGGARPGHAGLCCGRQVEEEEGETRRGLGSGLVETAGRRRGRRRCWRAVERGSAGRKRRGEEEGEEMHAGLAVAERKRGVVAETEVAREGEGKREWIRVGFAGGGWRRMEMVVVVVSGLRRKEVRVSACGRARRKKERKRR